MDKGAVLCFFCSSAIVALRGGDMMLDGSVTACALVLKHAVRQSVGGQFVCLYMARSYIVFIFSSIYI